ncbi:MAG: hypothetical protein J6A22_07370 [Bacteroidales bacterium]|nr:hypothetical protein [Bacteroidales bacterium]
MGLIITLIIVGLILLLAEALLVPGVGVAGVLGLLSLVGSCFCAFSQVSHTAGVIVTIVNSVLVILLLVYALRAKTWKKFALETNIDSKAIDSVTVSVNVGLRGKTVTRLAPVGTVRFGDDVVEVKALEGIIDPGVDVEIVLIEDNKVYVSEVGLDEV